MVIWPCLYGRNTIVWSIGENMNESEHKILEILASEIGNPMSITKLTENIRLIYGTSDYKNVHSTIHDLINRNILKFEKSLRVHWKILKIKTKTQKKIGGNIHWNRQLRLNNPLSCSRPIKSVIPQGLATIAASNFVSLGF